MEQEFKKTFDQVAVEFHTIFGRLFGMIGPPGDDGSGDLTTTGIDIEARLPGGGSKARPCFPVESAA
jgi:chromosome segregation ATPase